jgi:hypothetical protein
MTGASLPHAARACAPVRSAAPAPLLRCIIPTACSDAGFVPLKRNSVVPEICCAVARVCVRALLISCFVIAPATAATLTVPEGADLQLAIDSAQPGDVILLAPGATYTGNFRLPLKPGNAFVTIRTDAPAHALPGDGVRMSPFYAPVLAKIKSPNDRPALSTADGAHHYRLQHLEFQANAGGSGDIIVLGGSSAQTRAAQMPYRLVLDRVYIHGDPLVGQKRGIALNSGYTEVLNSYISDIKAAGQDSQALCGWNGSGPFLIENNYLEAAGENVMFGGSDPSIPGLVPSDITMRANLLSKPEVWRTQKWSVKNALEFKNARRVMIEGNIIENVWGGSQAGFAVLLTPRNQGGRAPWSVVEDVTMRFNVIRHAGSAFNISGWDDERPSAQTRRVQITDNLIYDIDGTRWAGAGVFLQIGNSPRDTVIERNTVLHTGTGLSVYGTSNKAPWVVSGFVFRDNLMRHNTYGVKGDGQDTGLKTLGAYFTSLLFDRNVLAGGSPSKYPAGNYFPTVAEFLAAFTNPDGEDFSLVPGTVFTASGSTGGPLGADISKVRAATRGSFVPSGVDAGPAAGAPQAAAGQNVATCRAGHTCTTAASSRKASS